MSAHASSSSRRAEYAFSLQRLSLRMGAKRNFPAQVGLHIASHAMDALHYFRGPSFTQVIHQAEAALSGPAGCECGCPSRLAHIHQRLGSTFYFDDDPRQLVQAFPRAERAVFTPQVLAACIVLTGRRRISPGERLEPPPC